MHESSRWLEPRGSGGQTTGMDADTPCEGTAHVNSVRSPPKVKASLLFHVTLNARGMTLIGNRNFKEVGNAFERSVTGRTLTIVSATTMGKMIGSRPQLRNRSTQKAHVTSRMTQRTVATCNVLVLSVTGSARHRFDGRRGRAGIVQFSRDFMAARTSRFQSRFAPIQMHRMRKVVAPHHRQRLPVRASRRKASIIVTRRA
jgi:hypothetical protein